MSGVDFAGLFDRAAPTYDRAGFAFFAPFGEALVREAGIRAGERVLDAACGAGAALLPAADAVGPDGAAVGIDLSPGMVGRARDALGDARPWARADTGDMQALPFEDDSFDVVTCAFAVFFPLAPEPFLAEARRVLVPGGRLALSTWTATGDPNWAWERELPRELGLAPPPEAQQHQQAFARWSSEEKVVAELRASGFAEPRTRTLALEFEFADAQAWWDWRWSQGMRAMLERLSEDELGRLRTLADTHIAQMSHLRRRFEALLSVAMIAT